VRLEAAELLGSEGEQRRQFLAGEPFGVRLRVATAAAIEAPRLSYELRDDSGLLVAGGSADTADLGWARTPGSRVLRFDVARLPLSEGRFHLRFGLTDASGEHLYHWLDDGLQFVVYPAGDERGAIRLDGVWSMEESPVAAELRTR
jgi:hypothetical protein